MAQRQVTPNMFGVTRVTIEPIHQWIKLGMATASGHHKIIFPRTEEDINWLIGQLESARP